MIRFKLILSVIFLINFVSSQRFTIEELKFLANENKLSSEFFKQGFTSPTSLVKSKIDDDSDVLCEEQIDKISKSLMDQWALQFIDAWGKIPPGLLWGHLRDLGNFDECMNITREFPNEKNYNVIQGKYCSAQLPIKEILESLKGIMPSPRNAGGMGIFGAPQGVVIGICVPEICRPEKVDEKLKIALEKLTIKVESKIVLSDSCIQKKEIKYEAIDVFAIVLFSLIGLIMLLSTLYDYYVQLTERNPKQLLIAFSILTNGKKIFQMNDQKSENIITCLNGIRCLSIVWVVFGHTYIMSASFNNINPADMAKWFETSYSMVLLRGTVSVDSFFLLSGLLLSWMALKEMEKNKGKLNILLMYFHRYIRLTPILAVSILFTVSLARYCGSGPYWDSFLKANTELCEKSWWSTLLYVQNYATPSEICLGHSWYLAVDTQLYFLSPLILIPLWIWGKRCIFPIFFLGLLSVACTFTIFILHNFSGILLGMDQIEIMRLTYFPTHSRYSPWLVGIVLGCYLHTKKYTDIRISKIYIGIGWLISLSIFASVIWGPYHRSIPGHGYMTNIESAFYESFSRVSWAIALAWIIFACHKGYGGIINTMLSWKIWQPLSRLSYSIYICHFTFQMIINGSSKNDHHFSDFETILKFWGDFAMTILISICTVLAFESPIIGIEKVFFGKHKKKRESAVINLPNNSTSNENFVFESFNDTIRFKDSNI